MPSIVQWVRLPRLTLTLSLLRTAFVVKRVWIFLPSSVCSRHPMTLKVCFFELWRFREAQRTTLGSTFRSFRYITVDPNSEDFGRFGIWYSIVDRFICVLKQFVGSRFVLESVCNKLQVAFTMILRRVITLGVHRRIQSFSSVGPKCLKNRRKC